MKIRNLMVASLLVIGSILALGSCASILNPKSPVLYKEVDDGFVVKIDRERKFTPIKEFSMTHAYYESEVNRAIANGGLIVHNSFRHDSTLNAENVNVRNEVDGITTPVYDPIADGMANLIVAGYPEVQIRQYFDPNYDGDTDLSWEYCLNDSWLESDPTSHQWTAGYTTKWFRVIDFNEQRMWTANFPLRSDAAFGLRDGDNGLYERDQYENIHRASKREVRTFWIGDTLNGGKDVIDYQPGGQTERMRLGRRHQDQGPPKPTFGNEPYHWYRVLFKMKKEEERVQVYLTDLGSFVDPSAPKQFNGKPTLVIDYKVEWNNSDMVPFAMGQWMNSSGRQEGDWASDHPTYIMWTRNWIASKKPLAIGLPNVDPIFREPPIDGPIEIKEERR